MNLIHKDCGGKVEVTLENDSGCSDPECCGGRNEWIEIECEKCKKVEKID